MILLPISNLLHGWHELYLVHARIDSAHPADLNQYLDMPLLVVDKRFDSPVHQLLQLDLTRDHLPRVKLTYIIVLVSIRHVQPKMCGGGIPDANWSITA